MILTFLNKSKKYILQLWNKKDRWKPGGIMNWNWFPCIYEFVRMNATAMYNYKALIKRKEKDSYSPVKLWDLLVFCFDDYVLTIQVQEEPGIRQNLLEMYLKSGIGINIMDTLQVYAWQLKTVKFKAHYTSHICILPKWDTWNKILGLLFLNLPKYLIVVL